MTVEGGEGEKGISKINLPMHGIEPRSPAQKTRLLTTNLKGHCY